MGKVIVLFVLVVLALAATTNGKRIPVFAGPYTITIRMINNETDEYHSTGHMWARLYLTPPKPKQKQNIWGRYFADIPWDDTLKLEIRVSQWSNNQWKRNAFLLNFDRACTDVLKHAKCIINFLYEPHERKCPLSIVGLRTIRNQTFEAVFPDFPILPYARYLFTMAFIKRNETVGIAVADGNVNPKL